MTIADAYRDSMRLSFREAIETHTLLATLGDVAGAGRWTWLRGRLPGRLPGEPARHGFQRDALTAGGAVASFGSEIGSTGTVSRTRA